MNTDRDLARRERASPRPALDKTIRIWQLGERSDAGEHADRARRRDPEAGLVAGREIAGLGLGRPDYQAFRACRSDRNAHHLQAARLGLRRWQFAPDGKSLAAGFFNGQLEIYDVAFLDESAYALHLCAPLLYAARATAPLRRRSTRSQPHGVARGTTVEMTVEGLNLARASAIYFSEPGITGTILRVKELPDLPDIRLGSNGTPSTIDLGPLPPRNQVTVEVDIAPEAEIGPVSFRLLTPLGTSPKADFWSSPITAKRPTSEPATTPPRTPSRPSCPLS